MSQIAIYNTSGGGGAGFIKTVTGDMGGSIPPDGSGNVNIIGGHDIVVMGSGNTLFVAVKNSISLGDLSPIIGSPAAELNTGDLSIIHGSIKLPTTTTDSLEGVIYQNAVSFLQTLGTNNLFIGSGAGNFTFNQGSATGNTALGETNLSLLTTGASNTALGNQAGLNLETGSQNTLVGALAGDGISSGAHNVMVGYSAGTSLTTSESSNILIGNTGTIGDNNTIRIGTQGAGAGQQNKAFMAGIVGVTVTNPAAVVIDPATGQLGVGAPGTGPIETITGDTGGPESPTAGNFNILGAHGINVAGSASTETVAINNAITLGDLSLLTAATDALTITSGDITLSGTGVNAAANINMPVTSSSGGQGVVNLGGNRFINNRGSDSVYIGTNSGNFTFNTGTSGDNTAIGTSTLTSITTGAQANVAIGTRSQESNATASSNVSIGHSTLLENVSSNQNTAVGTFALEGLVSGSGNNTAVGFNAGSSIQTGTNNILIGTDAGDTYTSNESNNIIIGGVDIAGDNTTIRIGAPGLQNKCIIAGIDGINVGSTATVVTESGSQLGTAVITAGSNITVTPGANTITIAATVPAGFTWSVITANQSAVVANGYIVNGAGTIVLTLPTTSAAGSIIEVTGINNATGWQIAQSAGQIIHFGTSNTTSGATGTLTSSATRDSIKIVCVVANLEWNVLSSIGNITIV